MRKPRKPFLYEVGNIVGDIEILEQFTTLKEQKGRVNGVLTKSYSCRCIACGYKYDSTERQLISQSGSGCPCCNRKIVVEHINSIVADSETHWMVDYFAGGWNEAKQYMRGSDKKINFKCPHCGRIKNEPIRIADLYQRGGISCSCNSTKISYGERICMKALESLGISYIFQYKPEWSEGRIYDFYIPQLNCILEIHGEQHYVDRQYFNTSLAQQQEIDNLKEKLARSNGVTSYYQLNCSKSTLSWMKSSLSSVKEIDWTSVDWNTITASSENNIVKDVCLFKENNPDCTRNDICEKFGISVFALRTYIDKGYELGWCTDRSFARGSKKQSNSKEVTVYRNDEFIGTYTSISECSRLLKQEHNIEVSQESIRRYCSGLRKPQGKLQNLLFTYKY